MSCLNPLFAVDYGAYYKNGQVMSRLNSDGKHFIKVLPPAKEYNFEALRKKYGYSLMILPCGKCVACAQDYSRTWQARIMCEADYHSKSCFITLTYAINPPKEPSKEHLRMFIKNVRNKFGEGIKFFACGEKGENTQRSHYHVILFGVDFLDDGDIIQKRGPHYLMKSPTLSKLWTYGFSSFGDLNIESAGYVSQYCNKKKIEHVNSGEFVIMSRGLGKKYFEEHYQEIFNSDYLYFSGNKFKIPRYFMKLVLKSEDFYVRCLADDYSQRKKAVAINFRYNHNRSVGNESNGMRMMNNVLLSNKKNKGVTRDVS